MILIIKRFLLSIFGRIIVTDHFSKRFPISVKGIIFVDDKILLLKNERNEWDLPGGKLNENESLEHCLIREFQEETNLKVEVEKIHSAQNIKVANSVEVIVVIYHCLLVSSEKELKISFEHQSFGWFYRNELSNMKISPSLKNMITQTVL